MALRDEPMREKLRAFFRANPKIKRVSSNYWKRAADFAKCSPYFARKFFYADGFRMVDSDADPAPVNPVVLTPDQILDKSLERRKYEARIKDLRSTVEALTRRLEESEARYDAALNIKRDSSAERIQVIESKNDRHSAVPVISISDIHIEERVERDTVNGINEYSISIAKERIRTMFANALKLVKMFQRDVDIRTVVIALLGDNITGYIHEELMENNELSPTEATLEVKAHLIEGIRLFADKGYKVVVPCSRGNHGRTSMRKRFSTGYKNSYEQMMYYDMAQMFKIMGYKDVEFITSKSEFVYIKIHGKMCRFCHGDHFGYSGGIGGIFPSMFKFLDRINKAIYADCTFMGHWHEYYAAARKGFVINGSIIGVTPYGMRFGPAPVLQNIQLIDSKRGFTGNWPIVV